MHILLTDILTCPVCGPAHGLIVRADRIVDRRVRDGALGCPNCRRQYPIRAGVARLVAAGSPPSGPLPAAPSPASPADGAGQPALAVSDPAEAMRIAALLGLGAEAGRATGFVALVGNAAVRAADVAALIDGQELVAVDARAESLDDSGHVSRIATSETLPFHDGKLRGIWLGGDVTEALLEEAARALHPLGRLVLEPAPVNARERLAAHGLRVLAHERETLVASRA